jgi:type VI secretion system protein ImpK
MGGLPATIAPPLGSRANLAMIYQEILTAITRFRSSRQAVTDAATFRNQIKGAIGTAEADATRAGYAVEDVRLATFAVVAFLDESILNSNNPIFADWPRMPLQEELFGVHTAGEMFFQCIDRLMAKSDTPAAIDVLEIYDLCMLLGFRGRYSMSGQESVRSISATVTDKMQRFHGGPRPLAPNWAPPNDVVQRKSVDPWVRALMIGALGALFFAVLFFVGFKFVLISGASGLHSIAPPH